MKMLLRTKILQYYMVQCTERKGFTKNKTGNRRINLFFLFSGLASQDLKHGPGMGGARVRPLEKLNGW